jgi:NAD(P)-dependent dehydrogenase (short-subunit alcohol dehydrogenase family)
MKNFAAKVVVITGAGSGIGRSLALKLARKGAFVAISDINEANLKETERLVQDLGGRVHAATLDVAKREAFYRYADLVKSEFGQVDVVINNAGVTVNERIDALNYDDFEWIMNINFWGAVYGTKAFLPYLKESKEAYIVNVSSVFGLIAFPTQGAYNASKFAVKGFTEALRYELADTSVTPICIHPGGIDTNIMKNARFHQMDDPRLTQGQAADQFRRFARTTPDEAAETIIEAIRCKNRRVLIGIDAVLIDAMSRLLPGTYDKLVGFFMNQQWLRG